MVGTTNKSMAAMSGAGAYAETCASNSLINWCTMKVRRLTG